MWAMAVSVSFSVSVGVGVSASVNVSVRMDVGVSVGVGVAVSPSSLWKHLKSHQDGYRIMTVRTHGEFIVSPHWDTKPQAL